MATSMTGVFTAPTEAHKQKDADNPGALLLASAAAQTAKIEYKKELETKNVLLISVDGMHQSDLQQWVTANPKSHLARLSRMGVTYTNAFIDGITDSFPGILALTTGGNIGAHNVYYDVSYDRNLWAPGTPCSGGSPNGTRGTRVTFDETIDKNSTLLSGGGNYGVDSIDPAKLPLDANCQPVYPHAYGQVNNIFECVRAHGGYTAWADKHPAYDLLNGPSGSGINDLYTPEINSFFPGSTKEWTTDVLWVQAYDTFHINAALNWIKGLTWNGRPAQVPTLFGFNMQSVSVAQKLPGPLNSGGYFEDGTFQPNMQSAMQFVDLSIGKVVEALIDADLFHCTSIVISAKHGQAPILHSQMKKIDPPKIDKALSDAGINFTQITTDDVAIIWLNNLSQTAPAVAALQAKKSELGIDTIYSDQQLVDMGLAKSLTDPRAAQIVIKVNQGVIYSDPNKNKKVAEHGGLNNDDQHVGLLVTGGGLPKLSGCAGATIDSFVTTRQVAPTILALLGIQPECLKAVWDQDTKVLPALFRPDACAPHHEYYYGGPGKSPERYEPGKEERKGHGKKHGSKKHYSEYYAETASVRDGADFDGERY